MTQYGIIYKIICSEEQKCYIGKTKKSINERWNTHKTDLKRFQNYVHTPGTKKRNFCTYLYRAMTKYGFDKFTIEMIGEASSKEELDALECESIKRFNSLAPDGYNLTTGGEGGWEHSPAIMEKMRQNTITGLHANIDKLRRNDLSKGLPVHVIWTILKNNCEAYMIQNHPLCKFKVFKFKDYDNSGEQAKKACLEFLDNLITTRIPYKTPKVGDIDIKGIRKIANGYQVKKMRKAVRYVKDFVDSDKTDTENFEDAKKYLEQLIASFS